MPVLVIDPAHPEPDRIERAAAVLRRGGLVAFPTETVYGLGANALDASAVRRIYDAKGRPSYNPLIAHVHDVAAARALVSRWPAIADRLAARFWPGPLTLVLPRSGVVPDIVTAGLDTVAIRIPAHPVAHALIAATGLPIAAPSANRFTALSPTRAEHVLRGLGDRVEVIIDGGATSVGIESTVIDVSGDAPTLLRPGIVSAAELEAITGRLGRPAPLPTPDSPRPAPGMLPRHYAPHATVHLFASTDRATATAHARAAVSAGRTVGALLLSPFDAPISFPIQMPHDPAAYAHELYAALHTLDAHHCTDIWVERPGENGQWEAILDRLERGATT
jgi:L-threonylcarbamoyladenylate synthase